MELRGFLTDCLSFTYQRVVASTKDLTPTQLHWQPVPTENHAAFLAFHIFRVYDRYFHRFLSPQGELWERNKWSMFFTVPATPPDATVFWSTGRTWTPQEVSSFRAPLDRLLAYGDSVYQSGLRKLATLDMNNLERPISFPAEQITPRIVLHRMVSHPMQHVAQIEYLKGLMKQQGVA